MFVDITRFNKIYNTAAWNIISFSKQFATSVCADMGNIFKDFCNMAPKCVT